MPFPVSPQVLSPFTLSKMSLFYKLVTFETVERLGAPMHNWSEDNQALLREGMILAMKEHPDWTEEEVLEEMDRQIQGMIKNWPICGACEADYATMPNEYGPDAVGERVCADCFWDFQKECRYLLPLVRASTKSSSVSLHAFCQGCGDPVKACLACEKRTVYHLGHCKDCYPRFRNAGELINMYRKDAAPLFLCKGCEAQN